MDSRGRIKRALVTVAGALVAAIGMFVLLTLLNAERGFTGSTGTSPLGWTIPLLSGILIGGVAWMLLLRGPRLNGHEPMTDTVPCDSCGRQLLADWRLCPFCGTVPGRVERPSDSSAATGSS